VLGNSELIFVQYQQKNIHFVSHHPFTIGSNVLFKLKSGIQSQRIIHNIILYKQFFKLK